MKMDTTSLFRSILINFLKRYIGIISETDIVLQKMFRMVKILPNVSTSGINFEELKVKLDGLILNKPTLGLFMLFRTTKIGR